MDTRSVLRVVGSIKFAAVILVMLCIAMACATVYEAMHGTPAALAVFYKSWWFEGLLGLLAINILGSLLARFPWSRRQVGFVVAHASVLVILGGAWVSKHWGIDGQVSLAEGQSVRQFTISKDVLSVRSAGETLARDVDLEGTGGLLPVDSFSMPPAAVGDLRLTVQRYVPDSRVTERIVDDNAQPNCALEVRLAGADQFSTAWVFAGQKPDPINLPISLRTVADNAEIDRFLAAPASQPAGTGTIKAEVKGAQFEFPLDQCLAGPVKLGETGFGLRATRYLPHALVSDGKLTNASDRPVNPMVELDITGPAGTAKRFAFARYPEFGNMHGKEDAASDVKVALNVPSDDNPVAAIEILASPQGRLAARFTPDKGPAIRKELKLNSPVERAWASLTFTVLRRFDHARREQVVDPVDPPAEDRTPAIVVAVQAGDWQEQVWLRKLEPRQIAMAGKQYDLVYGDKSMPLGFEVHLDKFEIGHYPGSGQPRSFESRVQITDAAGAPQSRLISMNNPAKCGGYTLFQSSYQPGRGGRMMSILSVSWDPGQPIVFTGYFALIAGMLYTLVMRMKDAPKPAGSDGGTNGTANGSSGRTQVIPTVSARSISAAKTLVIALAVTGTMLAFAPVARAQSTTGAAARPVLPRQLDLSVVRAIPVQHNGRWMPLDTLARDMAWSVTGQVAYRGQDAVLWLLAWTFDPPGWEEQPLITIHSAELRGILELPSERTEFSYLELAQHQPLRKLFKQFASRTDHKKPDPLESKVADIQARLVQLQDVFSNEVMRFVPDAGDAMGAWKPIGMPKSGEKVDAVATLPLQMLWEELKSAFLADNPAQFTDVSRRLASSLAQLPAAHRPTDEALATELRYNRLQPYSLAWKLMVLGALAAAIAVGVQRRGVDVLVIAIILAGFGMLTYGIWLRGQIAGRLPAANMFESLLFLSWGAGLFAVISMLALRDRLVPLTASAVGALALFLADVLPIDHFIRPIAPVLLDTAWMTIHVPGIMASYAVLFLAALIAHAQIVAMALVPGRRALVDKLDSLHYWYMHVGTILLGAGIITGSMWAASSWGRYWGWDPKEVWSLVAFLAYGVILHVRIDRERTPVWVFAVGLLLAAGLFAIVVPKLEPLSNLKAFCLASSAVAGGLFVVVRGQFATAFKSVVAFWFIIMTYVGVNYVLGIGLHSYGFGTGAVAHYMLLTGSIDLAIVGLLTVIHLARSGRRPTLSGLLGPASAPVGAGTS